MGLAVNGAGNYTAVHAAADCHSVKQRSCTVSTYPLLGAADGIENLLAALIVVAGLGAQRSGQVLHRFSQLHFLFSGMNIGHMVQDTVIVVNILHRVLYLNVHIGYGQQQIVPGVRSTAADQVLLGNGLGENGLGVLVLQRIDGFVEYTNLRLIGLQPISQLCHHSATTVCELFRGQCQCLHGRSTQQQTQNEAQ